MSVKIKDAIILENVTSELKIPVGNAGDEVNPLALTVGQIKDFSLSGLSSVATTGSFNDLTDKPNIPSITRKLLITYDDGSTETIKVYTA
jgi:hypothetical protein